MIIALPGIQFREPGETLRKKRKVKKKRKLVGSVFSEEDILFNSGIKQNREVFGGLRKGEFVS